MDRALKPTALLRNLNGEMLEAQENRMDYR